MISLATSHIAHKCNQLNHVTLPISMPHVKALFFIKIALKLSHFCKLMQNFRALGALPQTPIGLRRLEAPPPDPQNSPPIANFWLRACQLYR